MPEEEEAQGKPSAVGEAGKKLRRRATGKALRKGAEVAGKAALNVTKAAGSWALKTLGIATSEVWVPIVVGIIILIIGIVIIVLIIIWILWLMYGGAGKGMPMPINPSNPDDQKLISEMDQLLSSGKIEIIGDDDLPTRLDKEEELPTEREFLLGKKAHPDIGYIDRKLLKTLIYLGNKHDYEDGSIGISHIIYPYIYMPIETIETKDTKDEKFLKSISAHKSGQAADIAEIDKVCKKCKCSTKCGDDKVPIQVVWQDDPVRMPSEDRGVAREGTLASVEESLGLSEGSLEGDNLEEVIENTGRTELERYLGLESGSLDGDDLGQVVENLGRKELNEKLGLLPETDIEKLPQDIANALDNDLEKLLLEGGQSKIEEVLNLPEQGFQGNNLEDIAKNLGQVKVERELGFKRGTLSDPNALNAYINRKWGEDQANLENDLKEIAVDLELPETILVDIVNKVRGGEDISKDLRSVGTITLSRSLGFEENFIATILASPRPEFNLPDYYNDEIKQEYWEAIGNLENTNGLPPNSLKNLLDTLAQNGDPKDNLELLSSEIIGNNLGLGAQAVYDIARKGYSLNEALSVAEMTRADLAMRLGLSEDAAALIFSPTGNLKTAVRETGQLILALETGLPYDLLGSFVTGDINYNTLISQSGVNLGELSQSWGLPESALGDLISGNPKKAFVSIGKDIFKKNFNISGTELDVAFDLIASRNFKGAAEQFIKNEVFVAVGAALGLPTWAIPLIINAIENPKLLLKPDLLIKSILHGVTGMFGGILGGILGGGCSTKCYRPQARIKVHQVTKELMEMPSYNEEPLASLLGLPDLIEMRITQLIVWSYERDVLPFETGAETPTYEEVYGKRSLPNYGLFATTENNYLLDHIHIGF